MNWRWIRTVNKDKRLPQATYLTCKAASQRLIRNVLYNVKIFHFAERITSITPKKLVAESSKGKKNFPLAVTELGRVIELPENYPLFRSYDPGEIIQKIIIKGMVRALDQCSAGALKLNALKITTSTTILKKLIVGAKWKNIEALLGIISGYMPSCTMPYEGDHYIGIAGVKFCRAVKTHNHLLLWKRYLKEGDVLFAGEFGATNNIRWIECLDTRAFLNDAVVFGDNGLLIKEVQPLELRAYGKMIAWYGILGFCGQNVLYIPDGLRNWHD